VVTLQTGGVPESIPADVEWRAPIEESLVKSTLLGRAATLEDVGNVAVFAASDWARTITGAAINMTCGAFVD
jgi:enoyl-[acyl-carrier-protein] reductase (NADH)